LASAPDEVMFSASVRAEQERRGSRDAQARRAAAGRFKQDLSREVIEFIGERNSAYIATASADGQPYVQHRGGPAGFLRVLDPRTIAFPNYAGNSQYISLGNLSENERAFLFLMDYAGQRRLKLWGRARIGVEAGEETVVFSVLAWDWNCSQHIPKLVAG
jgi:predicted pyridoxine 5'-phosphate oxidase superfamily flavin-nucleotide-binding protein